MTWLLRLLLFLFIFYLLRRLFSVVFGFRKSPLQGGAKARSFRGGKGEISGSMAKDPQCGMHVATSIAVTGSSQGQTYYFCSEKCRDEYLRGHREPVGS